VFFPICTVGGIAFDRAAMLMDRYQADTMRLTYGNAIVMPFQLIFLPNHLLHHTIEAQKPRHHCRRSRRPIMKCTASFLHLPLEADASRIAVTSQGSKYRCPVPLYLLKCINVEVKPGIGDPDHRLEGTAPIL
jgi:hypothetical protein